MSHFCLLSDPDNYVPDSVDLRTDEPGRKYWLDHFAGHFTQCLEHALTQYGRSARKQIAAAGAEFTQSLEKLRQDPQSPGGGRLDIIALCRMRDGVLRSHGLKDPFMRIKQRENASAIALYGEVVARLAELRGREKWLALTKGVFAGNIFDLGSAATMHLAGEATDFVAALADIKPRPWHVDDFDRLAENLPDSPPTNWRKAVIFVDNAGSDFVLGVMPLARELAMFGTMIVLAANELPSLNDITADETVIVIEDLCRQDDDLAALVRAGMFEVVSSGNDLPLIDLSDVSDELNESAADADLVLLEGMGRGVETNLDASFKTDALRLALLKDPHVAASIGGEVFDCVCKYDSVPSDPAPSD